MVGLTRFIFFASVCVCAHLTRGDRHQRCECTVVCADNLRSRERSTGYYYTSNAGCVQLTPNCSLSHSACVFESVALCEASCVSCEHSPHGCCPDGSPRSSNGHCAGDTEAAQAPGQAPTVRWDLVSLGVVGTLLLVSVLVIVGVGVYYKHKYRQRKRSRYIHEVLQMYDGSSDSLSDTSIDDNPESNNLFERL